MTSDDGTTSASNKRIKLSIVELAENAINSNPNSDIEIAIDLLKETVPDFLLESNDRLVKVGRSVRSLLSMRNDNGDNNVSVVEAGLDGLIQECQLLTTSEIKVPHVRFGKTELQMSIITLGCMRFQQKWGSDIKTMNEVGSDCQDNLLGILKRCIDVGINHIETATVYGCSELQLGCALKQLFTSGYVKREDLIIQSKANSCANTQDFRKIVEQHFELLQVDYLDLFAFHGLNGEWHWDYMFGGGEEGDNCWNVIQEYKAAGKIKHIGFSTHGSSDLIGKLIETDKFDYVNLHYHFCGSYTTSCMGENGTGNLKNLRLMKERDMGAFVISGMDKGGKLYAPSKKLRSLTLPDLEPMAYGSAWLWNHHELEGMDEIPIHTFSVGAARAADLDQPAVAAYLQGKGELLPKVKSITARMHKAQVDALGQDWLDSYFVGLIKSYESKYHIEHNQIIWMYNVIKAFGLLEFARDRYRTLEGNSDKWDDSLSVEENIDKRPRQAWGYCPGLRLEPGKDYFADDLTGVSENNRAKVKEAYDFVYKWCDSKSGLSETPPKEWETSYEMKPWKDFPDR